MTLTESIKNCTVQRNYTLSDLEGNTALRFSYFMDSFIAMYSWLTIRRSISGPLFGNLRKTNGGSVIDVSKPWSSKKFTAFLRESLSAIGVGEEDVFMYAGYSIKRGSVQLYRSLGLLDEGSMEIIQMKGHNAYANYCSDYNDLLRMLPRDSHL